MRTLNPEVLHEIAIETRQCFLNEDAPVYLANLQKGLAQIQSGQPDYVFLMHAAHSLKGGSAIAELSSLSELAHKLEDVLEILQHHEFGDRTMIAEVLSNGIDEVAAVLAQAISLPTNTLADIKIDQELLHSFDALLAIVKDQQQEPLIIHESNYGESESLGSKPIVEKSQGVFQVASHLAASQHKAVTSSVNNDFSKPKSKINSIVRSSLEKDLESCIKQVEAKLLSSSNLSETLIRDELQCFCEECLLLGDTLSLDWLINIVEPFEAILHQEPSISSLLSEVQVVISTLRSQRLQYLYPSAQAPEIVSELSPQLILPLEEKAIATPQMGTKVPTGTANSTEAISYLRIPSAQIESMTNTVAEMILRHERLLRQQQQLGQTNKNLQALVLQMIPLQEQVQTVYDQLAIARLTNNSQGDTKSEDLASHASELKAVDDDFDQLELDQYSSSHSTLQNLQEVLLRVRESRADIDLSYRDLGEEIEYLRQDLDRLYAQLTQSRLVPFKTLASRFLPQLKRLCQRYNKQVELVIRGEDVLIDQVLLEQLQTPLNHLLINAFDHGVEPPEIRLSLGKSEVAVLTLSAAIAGNQVVISLQDDGDGINLHSVYKKAVENNICPAEIPIGKIPRQEILNLIFQPHFSTRNIVSDISGRGMGLDIVRSQINRLRGNIQVETLQGQDTTFTIRLPLGLSLITLLICAIGENLIAIPANDVLDIFPYAEAQIYYENNSVEIAWRKKFIPLIHLKQALPYSYQNSESLNSKVCLVLNRNDIPIAVAIDTLIEERQLILKPFDRSVVTPNYLAGCTILGTGQVVPVLIPDNLNVFVQKSNTKNSRKTKNQASSQISTHDNQNIRQEVNQTVSKTIVIAEDSIATRNMLERVLKQLDFEVMACRDGQEAIDVLNRLEGKVTMVISDVEMPKVNGFNLLQTIRTHDLWYTIPVVMLTSRTGDRHRQKAISLGANGYLSKPIIVGELIDCLGELVQ
ncbi:hybrid sensor histidine kinase/response regulator [Pseudanabaena minima]|uniref:hybrid sensor histidine kinase/response regulator n=1 Tax=Pseudanabaena minima TaxID=890415 RepID=UPI003DA8B479